MKPRTLILALSVVLVFSAFHARKTARAGLGDFFDAIKKSIEEKGISQEKVAQGLKEALMVGTGNAVAEVSKLDGYLKNPKIRIPLPEQVKRTEKLLRAFGLGPKVEELEVSMNRAAEKAAPGARPIFIDAIKKMTFTDARKILKGRDDEATRYFEKKTSRKLKEVFRPLVHDAMSEVGVTRTFQELNAKVKTIPYAEKFAFDLDGHVTGFALEGLFYMLALEEKKIREDPAARVTELLREVFGNK